MWTRDVSGIHLPLSQEHTLTTSYSQELTETRRDINVLRTSSNDTKELLLLSDRRVRGELQRLQAATESINAEWRRETASSAQQNSEFFASGSNPDPRRAMDLFFSSLAAVQTSSTATAKALVSVCHVFQYAFNMPFRAAS